MKVFECRQGSAEWWFLKKGRPSASEFDKIFTPKTKKTSTQARSYMYRLAAETLAELPPDGSENYVTRPMQDGINTEPEARRWYELQHDLDVRQVGFITTDDGKFGCSPDGLVGEDGGLELKCPQRETHIGYIDEPESLLDSYRWQVHGALWITGRSWWELVSYCHGLPPVVLRVDPGEDTKLLVTALAAFWQQYAELLVKLKGSL